MTGHVRWRLAVLSIVGIAFGRAGTGFTQSVTTDPRSAADANSKTTSAQASTAP